MRGIHVVFFCSVLLIISVTYLLYIHMILDNSYKTELMQTVKAGSCQTVNSPLNVQNRAYKRR